MAVLSRQSGLNCAQSSFRRWISQRNEFQSYFDGKTNRTVNGVKRDCKSKAHIITYQREWVRSAARLERRINYYIKDW